MWRLPHCCLPVNSWSFTSQCLYVVYRFVLAYSIQRHPTTFALGMNWFIFPLKSGPISSWGAPRRCFARSGRYHKVRCCAVVHHFVTRCYQTMLPDVTMICSPFLVTVCSPEMFSSPRPPLELVSELHKHSPGLLRLSFACAQCILSKKIVPLFCHNIFSFKCTSGWRFFPFSKF